MCVLGMKRSGRGGGGGGFLKKKKVSERGCQRQNQLLLQRCWPRSSWRQSGRWRREAGPGRPPRTWRSAACAPCSGQQAGAHTRARSVTKKAQCDKKDGMRRPALRTQGEVRTPDPWTREGAKCALVRGATRCWESSVSRRLHGPCARRLSGPCAGTSA
jgi:hypothetical protein